MPPKTIITVFNNSTLRVYVMNWQHIPKFIDVRAGTGNSHPNKITIDTE
jgi:hypothetical protein